MLAVCVYVVVLVACIASVCTLCILPLCASRELVPFFWLSIFLFVFSPFTPSTSSLFFNVLLFLVGPCIARVDIAEWSGVQVAKFDHLACFTGGMYALGAVNLRGEVAADKQELPDRRMQSFS